jgi:hypothetical protein
MMLDNVDRISAPDCGLKRLGRIRGRSVDLQDDAGNAFHQAFDIAEGLRSVPRGQEALQALDLDVDR